MKRETQLDRQDSWELSDLWTPGTLTCQAQKVGDKLTRITERTKQREMAQQSEMAGMENFLEMMMKMRPEDKREQRETEQKNERERLKREERKEREESEREDRRDERQLQLLAQLKDTQPAVPQQVTVQNHKLPQMNERDEVDIFVQQLEAAMVASDIPRDKWKRHLHSQLTLEVKQKVMHLMQDPDASYDDIRAAMMGCLAMTFDATVEAIFSADKGKITKLTLRQVADKAKHWATKLFQESETLGDAADKLAVAFVRSLMVPELKNYLDLTDMQRFLMKAEEWERSQPDRKYILKQQSGDSYNNMFRQGQHHSFSSGPKRTITCFLCGKQGHMSKYSRARIP